MSAVRKKTATSSSSLLDWILITDTVLTEILYTTQKRYAEMFPSIVFRATTLEVLCSGVGDTRNGELQLVC